MIKLYNTLSHKVAPFTPQSPDTVTMYVCGPTVYHTPHIGNARPCVVFDTLYRMLKAHYPKVIYASNITDIDDKIITRSQELKITHTQLTQKVEEEYLSIMKTLYVMPPDIAPRATESIEAIISMIQKLLSREHAYICQDHVLFHVPSFPNYGKLTNKKLDELRSDVRITTQHEKKHASDFVLWKPAKANEPSWESPWGKGRPGWHIECSAMIEKHLGSTIDIHGGGIDLAFPHHENEIAQSVCCSQEDNLAHYFMHNGHVTNSGEKMSKSLGNTIYLESVLQKFDAPIVRLALLSAHYRQPLDWTEALLEQCSNIWRKIRKHLPEEPTKAPSFTHASEEFQSALHDDLNTPKAIRALLSNLNDSNQTIAHCYYLGLPTYYVAQQTLPNNDIKKLIQERAEAKKNKDFAKADSIRKLLSEKGIQLHDSPEGTTWSYDG